MKISINWLRDFIQIKETAVDIAEILTSAGLEVESVEKFESVKGGLKGLVVGKVLSCEKHPDADKLQLTTVDVGNEILDIVCGASNVAAGQHVIVAKPGTTIFPTAGDPFTISSRKVRGVTSNGMICAEDEIGLGSSHSGIIVLNTPVSPGTPASEIYDVSEDDIIEIGLTPNRGDAASHFGVARDLKAALKREIHLKEFSVKAGSSKKVQVRLEAPEDCIRYSGLTIEGIKIEESPDWLKNKLLAIGINPINNVVDITNYILHDLGQPLHAFDLSKISGNEVIVKKVPKGTPFRTLDGVERKLNSTDLMICNASEPMCIAGVFGGEVSGVKNSTTGIFLESACFSADSVRRTSMAHSLKTDSSFRFERGTDPEMPVFALNKAAKMIVEIAGGEITSTVTDIYPNPVKPKTVKTSIKRINRLVGKAIAKEEILQILELLDIKKLSEEDETITFSLPPYRVDVERESDLIEEFLRIYGYDNIEVSERLSSAFLANFPEKDSERYKKNISLTLSALGFNEIVTNSLTSPAYAKEVGTRDFSVEILNPLSEDLSVMRQSLLFTGAEVIAHNLNRKQGDLKLFEFGKVYKKGNKGYIEEEKLGVYLTGNIVPETWMAKGKPTGFYELKTIILEILHKFNISSLESETADPVYYSEGLQYSLKGKQIVSLGQIKPNLGKLAGVKDKIYFAEFHLDNLFSLTSTEIQYQEVPKFPEVRRDLSLVLDKTVTFGEIEKLALIKEKNLLKSMNVFDIYEGENIGKDKKSYSISFILQDVEKTLTDKIIDSTMEKLMSTFEKELGAVIRK